MGRAAVAAVDADPDLRLVGVVSRSHGGSMAADLVPGVENVVVVETVERLDPADIDCLLDLTVGDAAANHMRWAALAGLDIVVGASGVGDDVVSSMAEFFDRSRCLVVPNFAIGAVLMMRFAELAAPYFDSVEIVELHHHQKLDAPSGSAVATASRIAAASQTWAADPTISESVPGSRGARVHGIAVHSIRMHGLLAHQEVMFGSQGQTLTIRQDTSDRSCFMPGVVLAVSEIDQLDAGVTVGLDVLLGV